MVNYFFDTYAIIELLKRNPSYLKYGEFPLVTTILNKIELYWWALTRHDETLANTLLNSLSRTVKISNEIIREAMIFRQKYKKREISYADAIGYCFAIRNNLFFLTGDRQFKDLPNVQYVE